MTYYTGPKWVKLSRYCELVGDTADSVQKKIARGHWLEGVQFRTGPDGVRYFNIPEIEQWVEQANLGVLAPTTKRRAWMSVGMVFTLQ